MRLALDLNAYFASCEQQERPELRGKAIAVAPVAAETTCCIAASYSAKKMGVKTGTRIDEARRLCPGLIVVEARPPIYIGYHERIKACIDRLCPIEAATSIDEFICELPATHKTYAKAAELALAIKRAMAVEVGECLTCSIGIAPNAWLAKVASDMQKPDGLVVIEPQTLPHILYGNALRDLTGVGHNMELRLNAAGIHTVAELCAASKATLRKVWGGIEGELFYERLRGSPVPLPTTQRSSLSHSHVISPDKRNDVDARAIIHRMLQKAATRLRKEGLVCGQLSVTVKFQSKDGKNYWGTEARFAHTDDSLHLTHHLDALWQQYPGSNRMRKPMLVGVVFSALEAVEHQNLPLLKEDQPHSKLMQTMDKLNKHYGKNTLYLGAAHKGRDHAPMRIAFTRIPDVEIE